MITEGKLGLLVKSHLSSWEMLSKIFDTIPTALRSNSKRQLRFHMLKSLLTNGMKVKIMLFRVEERSWPKRYPNFRRTKTKNRP